MKAASTCVVREVIGGYMQNRQQLVTALGGLDYTYGTNAERSAEQIRAEIARIDVVMANLVASDAAWNEERCAELEQKLEMLRETTQALFNSRTLNGEPGSEALRLVLERIAA